MDKETIDSALEALKDIRRHAQQQQSIINTQKETIKLLKTRSNLLVQALELLGITKFSHYKHPEHEIYGDERELL